MDEWTDQGDSVPSDHVAAFDWPSLPSSPPPVSGRHSRDRRAGETCELNVTQRLTAWQCGRLCDYMWVSFDPRERTICGLVTVAVGVQR